MEISSIVIGLLLFGVSVTYVVSPFRQKRQKSGSASQHSDQHMEKREAALVALRDLDFDFKTGKVSEEDYQPLRVQLMAEAAQYMDPAKKEDEHLEQMIQARRKVKGPENKCPQCEAALRSGQHFCSKCGFALNNELCPSCRKKIHSGDLFCSSCGNPIQMPVKAVAQS